jgi:hypothetical protein
MPFKNPAKRRQYHRTYKRMWRQRTAHPLSKFRVFICPHIPFLRVGPGISFENGLLVTDCPESHRMVEVHSEFGRRIFPLVIDRTSLPTKDDAEGK